MAQILIVEDEDDIRAVFAQALEKAGFDVVEAETADAATWKFESDFPEMLVTDIHLPGTLSGVGLAQMARDRLPGLPILFITGREPISDFTQPYAVLLKPFGLAKFIRSIRRLIDESVEQLPVCPHP
jgi:DNA-binding NtrC family response regulator